MNVLVLNAGSSSLKFDLWEIGRQTERLLIKGSAERVGSMEEALDGAFAKLRDFTIDAVGHRVVHGGDLYHASVIVDAAVERGIEELSVLAPLHNPHNLEGIRAARRKLPLLKQVAVFDTAFHHTLPPHAYAYALPYEYLTEKKIRRYGFHGISHRYVSWKFADLRGKKRADYRLITCHLGNGCSVCAIDHGISIDTSMGFTPLEGLVMGTRSGDIDAGAILHLIDNEKIAPRDLLNTLNSESGLKGVSGVSNDMRDVMASAKNGNERAALAVEMFCYRVRKYVGAYAAVMNGADALIFTGGIGENSPEIRERICNGRDAKGMNALGIAEICVVPTEEELLIARDTTRCIAGLPHE